MVYGSGTYRTVGFVLFTDRLTDLLDGWIATFNCVTEFGKLFDPVVDKFFRHYSSHDVFDQANPVWVPIFMIIRGNYDCWLVSPA